MKPTDADLHARFFFRKPTPDTLPRFEQINEACFELAKLIRDKVPEGIDLSLALMHLEDARMRANFGISLETSTPLVSTPVKP